MPYRRRPVFCRAHDLEDEGLALLLLVATKLEVLAPLQRQLLLRLALAALKTQHDLLGRLRLLVEDGLGLTTVTRLLSVITTLALSERAGLSGFVLGNTVKRVLVALRAAAVGPPRLGNVDHGGRFLSVGTRFGGW
jgi:hypothetical protein